ncbi:MAG: GNAT family acetyltransferase [Clostridiales bacterium]|nr:GNAT family acetyltransferase [Clostridiales bacterium]
MDLRENAPAVRRQDLYKTKFYDKSMFSGSLLGMNYRIEKAGSPEGGAHFKVTVWPGPMNFDHTDEKLKAAEEFPFTDEALGEIADYLNQYHEKHFA